jgi:SpoVK/Ycf46/Vps4 family AAA+-type ATPase
MLLTIDTLSEELGLVEAEKMPKGTVAIQAPTEAEITYTVTSRELVMKEDRRETYDPMSAHVSTEGFDMIGGLTQAKRELQNLAEILHDPITAKIYGVAPRPFLLHGPPGTGKTSLVTALANQIGAELKIVSSTDIIEKWVGSSGKNVRKFFDKLIEESANKTVVVLFDEFEALAQKGGGQERLDVKKQLNLGIENIVKNHPNIILGAAANMDMDDLEPSLIRSGRFKPIGAPLPNEDERVDVWAAVLAKSYVSFANIQRDGDRIMSQEEKPVLSFIPYEDDIDPKALAKITDGMTGADFDEILTRARLRQYVAYRQGGGVNKVSQADLITEVTSFGR